MRMISKALFSWMDWRNLMDDYSVPIVILSIAIVLFTCHEILTTKKKKLPLPPWPRGLPILGNLPFLDRNLHTDFARLAKIYGPIFKIHLGSKLTFVPSSPSLVKAISSDNGIIFANRNISVAASVLSHGGKDVTFSPYGHLWRMLRKVGVKEFMNPTTLDSLYSLRRREVRGMVNQIYLNVGNPIHVYEYSLFTMINAMTRMFWGDMFTEEEQRRLSLEFREVLDQIFVVLGAPNVSDIFPLLAVFDFQGVKRKMKKHVLRFDQIFDFVIDKRLQKLTDKQFDGKTEPGDFLQALLQFKDQGEHKVPFTTSHIKGMLLEFLLGGTRTSSTAVEWLMAELVKNPSIMQKVQNEIDEAVGMNSIVEEHHIPKLRYLNAVVKETMRLHPIGSLLLKNPSQSCMIGEYMIPKGSQVFINVWALQRDPEVWDNPSEFRPERFLDSNNDASFKGTNYSYLPFGTGRRYCIGLPLVERFMPYLVASMVHSFNWKLLDAAKLDLSDTFGVELKKTVPLLAIPEQRLSDPGLYT